MKFWPHPAPQRAGPRTGNGAGDHLRGPARCAATGSRRYLRCPAFFYGAPLLPINFTPEMRVSGTKLIRKSGAAGSVRRRNRDSGGVC